MSSLTILHTSDFHGHLDIAKAEKLRIRKKELGALYFDCGDLIKAGNLALPTKPDSGWSFLETIGVDAVTLGNRETHPLEAPFGMKLSGCKHALVANLYRKGQEDAPLSIGSCSILDSLILEHAGLRVGCFGVMVPMVTKRMKTAFASAYLWEDPVSTAKVVASKLRNDCDVLIALTHVGLSVDKRIASECPEIDLILGGHSHDVLEQPLKVGKTFISHTGSHGRLYGEYKWSEGKLRGGLYPLR